LGTWTYTEKVVPPFSGTDVNAATTDIVGLVGAAAFATIGVTPNKVVIAMSAIDTETDQLGFLKILVEKNIVSLPEDIPVIL
jgi:hypothetical protein